MFKIGSCLLLPAILACSTSCREKEPAAATAGPPPVIAAELTANGMKGAPQGLLASRAASPVHWQHWEPALLGRAKDARRLIFAVIGSAQYPGCVEALDSIDRDAALVSRLNQEFIPVLVDVDLCRESGLVAGLLSQEIKLPVSFPFILVLSPDGHEVTWRPITFVPGGDLGDLFDGATDVITRMWQEDPAYVKRNSAHDHGNRTKRQPAQDPVPDSIAVRDDFLNRATRQLVSLYDEDIGMLSGTGGLLPLGTLQCLASASLDPATSPEIATRCREAVNTFGANVLNSAMVDPLDGGVYSSRRGNSWDLPMTHRTCMTQARAARALVTLHAATRAPRALEVALGAVNFAEQQFAAQDGLFSNQRVPAATATSEWLWTREMIDQALDPQEAALWKALCGITDIGNLAMEADPRRQFFRLNSLGFRIPLAAAAAEAKLTPEQAAALLETGRKKLLTARLARVPQVAPSPGAAAAPSFRMISAYAALFTATGDPAWRDKAIALAKLSRQTFSQGSQLVEQSPAAPAAVCDARAFTYALAIQAALDLAEVTLDENWRLWAGDLATTVAENFIDDAGHLMEARPGSTPLQLRVEDRLMLFDDSTAGLMRMNLARLEALGQSPPPALKPWIRSLPPIANFPVVFTDSILATSFARSRVIIELPADASPAWREAAAKLPLDRIARHLGKGTSAKVRRADGSEIPVADPAALAAAVLPAAR
jgi:uncharacterized protein YyaL (SSP411 family)